MQQTGNTILISGGGSGIGASLAQRFNDLGNTVIVTGRRREALEETIAGRANMHAVTLDIESADGVERFADALLSAHPAVNVLINNAGIMRYEDATARRDLSDAQATIATNLLGPIRLINALVEHLSAQPNAAIVNVTSGLAFVPLVIAPTYSATKAAMHSYTVALRNELAGKVEVIELAPPAVQTGLTPGQESRQGYLPLDAFIDEVMTLFGTVPTPSEILVQAVQPLRFAEAKGQSGQILATITATVKGGGH